MKNPDRPGRPKALAPRLRKELENPDLTFDQRLELMKLLQAEEEIQRVVRLNMRKARLQRAKIRALTPKKSKSKKVPPKPNQDFTLPANSIDDILA